MRGLFLLHPTAQVGASFTVHPSTVAGLVALAALYEWRARRAPADTVGSPTLGQRAALYTGLLLIFLSLNGPIHDLSDAYLFSAHMVQHLVLELVVPPLVLVATPGWMLRPLLSVGWVRAVAERVTRPAWAFGIFNLVLAAWHVPAAYNLALAHHPVHITQHLMFISASVLMWWPLLGSLPELPRPSYPAQLLYCFLMTIPMSVVSVCIVYADRILYPLYAIAPRILGISPLEDQRLGGLIMWVPGGLFFILVMSVVFLRWSQRGGLDTEASAQAVEPRGLEPVAG